VFIVRDGQLLVIHRRKRGESYDAIPGGKLETGETPEGAAVREVAEETGLTIRVGAPVLVLENEDRREYYFDALEADGEPVLGGPEAERHSPENAYVLDWISLRGLKDAPVKPVALKNWMLVRDWSGVGP
jgi:8-oxo-dGTP pyrophosphatase MutT (NUDIX family)